MPGLRALHLCRRVVKTFGKSCLHCGRCTESDCIKTGGIESYCIESGGIELCRIESGCIELFYIEL